MSALASTYTLFYPNSNTITALALFSGDGTALTPQSVTDEANPPVGWKAQHITFADNAHAVFATPTFQNANAPVPVYLTYSNGQFNVLDNIAFDPAAPGRPTPRGEHAINYTATPGGGEVEQFLWTLKTPTEFTPKAKPRTKDPVTGLKRYGNDFLMLWRGVLPDCIEVQCDVEDITDPAGFVEVGYTNVTSYAESSVGMSLVKLDSEIIPQDGFTHAMRFRIRYNCAGDVSPWVESAELKAVYLLPAPNPPASIAVNVLRDRNDVVPDRIQINWVWDSTQPGEAVEVYAIDYFGKKHLLGEENDNTANSMTVEGVTRFITVPRPPAVKTAYFFGVLSKNRSSKSDMVLTAAPVLLACKIQDSAALTPDEVAGTATTIQGSQFSGHVAAMVGTFQQLSDEQKASLSSLSAYAVMAVFNTIKDVVMKGGSVTVSDFGVFKAKWSTEHWGRNPATGEAVLIPAARGQGFTASRGYKVGTERGQLLTDEQAKNPPVLP